MIAVFGGNYEGLTVQRAANLVENQPDCIVADRTKIKVSNISKLWLDEFRLFLFESNGKASYSNAY